MEINIQDYLNHEEIKEVVVEELRRQIRQHFNNEVNAQRLLVNLAYGIVQEEVDKIVPNYQEGLVAKVSELVKGKHLEYILFNYNYSDNRPQSLGAKIVDQTVKENEQLIKEKVIDAIHSMQYSDKSLERLEAAADKFTSNIYDFVELMRTKPTH